MRRDAALPGRDLTASQAGISWTRPVEGAGSTAPGADQEP